MQLEAAIIWRYIWQLMKCYDNLTKNNEEMIRGIFGSGDFVGKLWQIR